MFTSARIDSFIVSGQRRRRSTPRTSNTATATSVAYDVYNDVNNDIAYNANATPGRRLQSGGY
jgi:hypothetical protein